jgi:hypothetical protein
MGVQTWRPSREEVASGQSRGAKIAFVQAPDVVSILGKLFILTELYPVRKHMTLRPQKLKMRCAHKSTAAALCSKLKTMYKHIEIYL